MRRSILFFLVPVLAISIATVSTDSPAAGAASQSSVSSTGKRQRWREFRRLRREQTIWGKDASRSSLSSVGPVKRTGQFSYGPYAPSKVGNGQESLLFFYGLWSIPSRANDAMLKQWAGSGGFLVPVYKVEYDKEVQMKKKYGVRYVNSFVLVDENGNKVKILESPYSPALSFILYGR